MPNRFVDDDFPQTPWCMLAVASEFLAKLLIEFPEPHQARGDPGQFNYMPLSFQFYGLYQYLIYNSKFTMDKSEPYVRQLRPRSLVDQITFTGFERTRLEVILREFERFEDLHTLEDVYQASEEIHRILMALDAFEAVDILIDQSSKDDAKVSVSVTASELGMLGVNAGTYVQGSEATAEATLNIRNYIGYAEKISLSVEQGISNSNVYSIRLQVPRILRIPYQMDLRIHQVFDNKVKWSSYTERLRGLSCSFMSDEGTKSLSYDCGWRTLSDPTREASSDIIRHLGESVKSSASFSFASTAFDENPQLSSITLCTVEMGGIGTHGMFQYIKGNVSSQIEYTVSENLSLALEGTLGVLVPSKTASKIDISPCDKFHAGGIGPYGLRGFHQCGLGRMSSRRPGVIRPNCHRHFDALGGTFISTILGALRFQLPSPTLADLGIQGQVFANIGVLGDLEEGPMRMLNLKNFICNNLRATIGVGVIWPLQIGQLEANICRVIRKGQHDYAKNGLQFGISPY